MQTLLQDLRYGLRLLWKSPAFTVVAVLTLALGIGANAAIFSVVNAVLLRPLPFPEPERLLTVRSAKDGQPFATTPPDFYIMREQSRSFEHLAAYYTASFNVTGDEQPERLRALIATAGFFPALGIQPALGRAFVRVNESWGSHRVVVISDGLWKRRFGGDPGVVGRELRLTDQTYEIVGVMPPGFRFSDSPAELWVPMAFAPGDNMNTRNNYYLTMLGRLRPGVSEQEARTELDVIARRIHGQFPETPALSADTEPLRESVVGSARGALLALLTAVGLVLLIACVNVANLLLARAAGRAREVTLRAALGASARRLVRQFLTESLLLSVAGALLGLLLAYWGLDLLIAAGAPFLPRIEEVRLDWQVVAFAALVAFVSGILFGLAPALHIVRGELLQQLREGGRETESHSRRRTRSVLVVAEVALAVMLLAGAGLMIKSFDRLLRVDPGFEAGGVLTFQLNPPYNRYVDDVPPAQFSPLNYQRATRFYEQFLARAKQVPGVVTAGAAISLPLTGETWFKYFNPEDGPEPASIDQVPDVQYQPVAGEYFRALSIPLRQGRFFDERDHADAPRVAIVNEALARRFWPGTDPIGKVFTLNPPRRLIPPDALAANPQIIRWTVVGVVADTKYASLDRQSSPLVYTPYAQGAEGNTGMFVAVRTQVEPDSVAAALRAKVWELDRDLPVANLMTMEERLERSVAGHRTQTLLFGLFSALALALAAVGIYGVMSYTVVQRTREIGVRMALGAQPRQVLRMVVGGAFKLTLLGISLGTAAALAGASLLQRLLFQVEPRDIPTFVAAALVLGAVALMATLVPARRAAKVDPMVALRYE